MRTVHLHTLSNSELIHFTKTKIVATTLELELSKRLEELTESNVEKELSSDEDEDDSSPRVVEHVLIPEGALYLLTNESPLVKHYLEAPERGSYEFVFNRWLNPDFAPEGFLEALDSMLSQKHVVLITTDSYYLKNCCATIKKYLEHTK